MFGSPLHCTVTMCFVFLSAVSCKEDAHRHDNSKAAPMYFIYAELKTLMLFLCCRASLGIPFWICKSRCYSYSRCTAQVKRIKTNTVFLTAIYSVHLDFIQLLENSEVT